jgi:ornithine cyclodeaminase
MRLITVPTLRELICRIGLEVFNARLLEALEQDFGRWQAFHLSPRHATHYPHGVIELMPCADDRLYSFKYVNGHPDNPKQGKLSVVALGLLAEVDSGYPLMLCEMTWLTALRTASTAALGAKHLARPDSRVLGIIGTGAQSEFQVRALAGVRHIETVRFFDIDPKAMAKFAHNLEGGGQRLVPCKCAAEVVAGCDLVVTATAAKHKDRIISDAMIGPGVHIHGLGGDCPGKTELDPALLERAKVVVEYLPQSRDEGEIQNRPDTKIHAELWELVSGSKPGRESADELTLFDSVGFALEDYAALRLVYELAGELGMGEEVVLTPDLADPKDLFGPLVN